MKIGIAFEPDLLAIMTQFHQFDTTLKKHMATATEKSGATILDSIDSHMPNWKDTDGTFIGSFEIQQVDEYSAYVGSPEPYGPRLNWGFDSTDSLGRKYHEDGTFFMEASIEDDSTLLDVAGDYIDAVYGAWSECVGTIPSGASAFMGVL